MRFEQRCTHGGDARKPGPCRNRRQLLAVGAVGGQRGADGRQGLVVAEGELTRGVEQPATALAFELVPQIARRQGHLDVVGVRIAQPEDAGRASRARAHVSHLGRRLEHVDRPAPPHQRTSGRESEQTGADDDAAAGVGHVAIIGRWLPTARGTVRPPTAWTAMTAAVRSPQ